jgi:transcriptional regulator with XRE-family HTH domain
MTAADLRAAETAAVRGAVASHLRALRAFAGLTQAETAAAAGLGKTTVERLENGTRDLDLPQLVALARVLDFNPGPIVEAVTRAARKGAAVVRQAPQ